MTHRLYYSDSLLYEFDARVTGCIERDGRFAVTLDRSAFYPTSGGQLYDTGALLLPGHSPENVRAARVSEVAEDEQGEILHFVPEAVEEGTAVHGVIDATRRRDHMQQHSGQHLLSAAFVRLFKLPTVSFHMGDESCTIDLETESLASARAERAEQLANEVVAEDRPVLVREVTPEEARGLGVRKLPAQPKQKLRLIDIADFDLTACGGTHVHSTGQVGAVLLRKIENVRQGVRVEFVCGLRAVNTARSDYSTLTQAAAQFSTHIREIPQQIAKNLEEVRASEKTQRRLLEELAELHAERLIGATSGAGRVVSAVFSDRDPVFLKLLAHKLVSRCPGVIALLACGGPQPTMIFARSPGDGPNMAALLKQAISTLGGRGGGSPEMAQGGVPAGSADLATIRELLEGVAARLRV